MDMFRSVEDFDHPAPCQPALQPSSHTTLQRMLVRLREPHPDSTTPVINTSRRSMERSHHLARERNSSHVRSVLRRR